MYSEIETGEGDMDKAEYDRKELELNELRLKVAKALGWTLVELTPTPDNKAPRTLSERTFQQFFAPGKANDNPYWTATIIDEWPENWRRIYLSGEIANWSRDIADAFELEDEIPEDQRREYVANLCRIVLEDCVNPDDEHPLTWLTVHATPEQRCRAWLAWQEAVQQEAQP
jgi:hypothetical protein